MARSSRPAHNTPIEFSEITASLLAARGARLLLVATQAEALAALAQELGASGAVVTTCTAASPRSTDFRGSVALAYQICEFRFRQALETRAPGCLRRLVRWFTGQSTLKLQQTVFALACLALGACSAELAEPRQFPQRVEGGNFTLYVSNQSFAIDPVDINVYFDDTLVVVRDFEVGSQHNWHEFEVVLTPGAHTLRALTDAGKAELEETFEIVRQRYGVLDFWYYPDGEPTPHQFSFDLYDQPPMFL